MAVSEEDRKITAYHEAGHALVGKMLKGTDPIHKVTIIPRGMALGLTQFLPLEDTLNLSKKKAENMIAMLFGGRVAEEIIFEDYTTGAGNDIERATDISRKMVCEWGMSEKMGPLAYEKNEGPVFLGMQNNKQREYSEDKAKEIDSEVHRIVMEGYHKAHRIISENIHFLHIITEALLEFETIDGDDVDMVMKGKTMVDIRAHHGEIAKAMEKEQEQGREDLEKKEAEEAEEEEEKKQALGDSLGGPVTA